MLFNSIAFAIFLPIVFVLYWFVLKNKKRQQNFLLLGASFYFYACWDWRFLFLLIFSIVLDYFSGIQIEKSKSKKMATFWLTLSIAINLGFLGFFKYYNFFLENFVNAFSFFGTSINAQGLNIILPVPLPVL